MELFFSFVWLLSNGEDEMVSTEMPCMLLGEFFWFFLEHMDDFH